MKNKVPKFSLQKKLLLSFIATTVIILVVNLFMYSSINKMIIRLDEIYVSNVQLNELSKALSDVQDSMTAYLNTKTSDSMENYYKSEQNYSAMIEKLSQTVSDNRLKLMERNTYNLSQNYLYMTNQTVEAKRGRNVEKYKSRFEKATELYEYIDTFIYSLNNEQFTYNTQSYKSVSTLLKATEYVSLCILLLVALCNIIIITLITRTITKPIRVLAQQADEVGKGNLDVSLIEVSSQDEIAIVSSAFNKMVIALKEYILQIREKIEKEQLMKERELLMQSHLKDAELKYLQAQINPHFLFNTLNAGAQLAMMEEADRTYEYVQKVADFYRYNMRKNKEVVSIREEMELIDNYIYILNVRFSGDIQYEKIMEESLLDKKIPSMILQPIVENSVNYGIRNIDWKKIITISIYEREGETFISIRDNGIGMSEERIRQIINNELKSEELSTGSNGVGLNNVISRLKLFYKRDDVVKIVSEGVNTGTEVIIHIWGNE